MGDWNADQAYPHAGEADGYGRDWNGRDWDGDPAYSQPAEAGGYGRDWNGDPLAQVAADAAGELVQGAEHVVENVIGNIGF